MTPEQFCFWLHGFFELTGQDELTAPQARMVREHLDLVFTKVTPPLGPPVPEITPELAKQLAEEGKKLAEDYRKRTQSMVSGPITTGRIC
jgi:hypothetical protein